MKKKPVIIVLTGPSGAGKDTVIDAMKKQVACERIVTHTDRPPRLGEVNESDYHFVDTKTFMDLNQRGEFIETKWFEREKGCWKGTSRQEFTKDRISEFVIWRVEVTRAATIEQVIHGELLQRVCVVYLGVATTEQLKTQLRQRDGHEDKMRIQKDVQEWEEWKNKFSNIVINIPGAPEVAAKEVIAIARDNTKRIQPA